MSTADSSPGAARALLISAAILWSSGSFFVRLLTVPTLLGLNEPELTPLQIAFFRGLFAGLVILPIARAGNVRFTPPMAGMVVCFAAMSGLYLSALGQGSAANAIFLQNTAPLWVYLLGVYLLGEPTDRRSLRAILIGMTGAVTIVAGNWPRGQGLGELGLQAQTLLMATGSGAMYACVILFLRGLRSESSAWLTVLNLLGSAAVIVGFVFLRDGWADTLAWVSAPTARQFAFLLVFGAVQMAAPYYLFSRGIRSVSAQEAGLITLLEPMLNPVWAYLISPDRETPTAWTAVGGTLLLGALLSRYGKLPFRRGPRGIPPS